MWLHSLIRLYRKEKQESAHRYVRAIQKKILISLSNVLKRLEKRLENKLLQDRKMPDITKCCPAFCDDVTEKSD